ncbi:MAG: tetratricopeptide repeat protein [Myxococcota bacterium]
MDPDSEGRDSEEEGTGATDGLNRGEDEPNTEPVPLDEDVALLDEQENDFDRFDDDPITDQIRPKNYVENGGTDPDRPASRLGVPQDDELPSGEFDDLADTDMIQPSGGSSEFSTASDRPVEDHDWETVSRAVEEAFGEEENAWGRDSAFSRHVADTAEDSGPSKRLDESTLAELRRTFSTSEEIEALDDDEPRDFGEGDDSGPATLDSTAPNRADEFVDPFMLTGVRLVEITKEADGGGVRDVLRAPEPPAGEDEQRSWTGRFEIELDGIDGGLGLDETWAQYVGELAQEVLVEFEPRLRSSYLYLLSSLFRLHTSPGEEAAERLESVASSSRVPIRSLLLNRLVKSWDAMSSSFFEALERLEAADERRGEGNAGGIRRASIAVERYLDEGFPNEQARGRLFELTKSPESLPGLALRVVDAIERGDRGAASRLFYRASRHVKGEPRLTLVQASAMLLRGRPEFFSFVKKRVSEGVGRLSLVQMMLREASTSGDHLQEAVALRMLVTADVAAGRRKQDGSASHRSRLKELAAARFFRLSTLLRGLGNAIEQEPALASLDYKNALRDAVALAPRNPLYLRRLARWSRETDDDGTTAQSMASLALSYEDGRLSALAHTEVARMVHLAGGQRDLVVRYLSEALEADTACARAAVAMALVQLSGGDTGGYEALTRDVDAEEFGIDFDDSLREMLEEGEFGEAAGHLERELESVVEPDEWARKTYLLSQIQAWFLETHEDSRLRTELLEQVLNADSRHMSSLVELTDLCLARRQYRRGAEVVERIAELIESERDRASWLLEYAELAEHFLVAPELAVECYTEAQQLYTPSADALFGLLRCDVNHLERGVDGVVRRLDSGVDVRESEQLSIELLLRSTEVEHAREVLDERFPKMPVHQLLRICRGVESGEPALGAVGSLREAWMNRSAEPVLRVFWRAMSTDETVGATRLSSLIGSIGMSPADEGVLLRAMRQAREVREPELYGRLAALRARRDSDGLARACDLTWMAITLEWRGEQERALRVCEELLGRFADYLPAIKLAKILCEKQSKWAQLARWLEREAENSGVPQIAVENRMRASEVQRRFLGDFDAAREQFKEILREEPNQVEAFEKLKTLLLQRGEVEELLDIYMERVAQTDDPEMKTELLNDAADIALHRDKNRRRAIQLLQASLDIKPEQLRSLRILAEIHEELQQYESAVACLRAARELIDNEELLKRMWHKSGTLYEKLDRRLDALDAYQSASRIDPGDTKITLDLARAEERSGDTEAALLQLQRVISTAASGESLREARARRARLIASAGRPEKQVLTAFDELFVHHPDELEAVESLTQYFKGRGGAAKRTVFLDRITRKGLLQNVGRPIEEYFSLAQKAGDVDRAFCLAGIGKLFGESSREMDELHDELADIRRWPETPLDRGAVSGALLPKSFLGPLRELLVELEPGVREALGAPPAHYRTQEARLDGPPNKVVELAFRWPALFGLELGDVYRADHLDMGSKVFSVNPVTLAVDGQWRERRDPTGLLVQLGRQLAFWAMGMGAWQWIPDRLRHRVMLRIVGLLMPGWGGVDERPASDFLDWHSLEEWVRGQRRETLMPMCERLSGRVSPQGLDQQFRLLELGVDRLACVLIDDPFRYLSHARYLGSEAGMLQAPWTFVVGATAQRIRREVGIARTLSEL